MVLALHLSGFGPWLQAELGFKDVLVRYGRKAPRHPDIVYLAIDQASVGLDGLWPDEIAASPALSRIQASGWPWTRDVYAMIIERLVKAGARVIAIDLLFPTGREGDEELRASLERHRDRVIVGSNFVDADRAGGQTHSIHVLPATSLIPAGAADSRVAYVNFWADLDGVVRRVYYHRTVEEVFGLAPPENARPLASLAARMAECAGYGDRIPAGTAPKVFRFAAGPGSGTGFVPLSVRDIFVQKIWENPPYDNGAFFKDKLVLVGPEGNWAKDYVQTPFGLMPGPEVHLHALNAALSGEFIAETPDWVNCLLIVLAGAAAWALSWWIDAPVQRFLLFIATAFLYLLAGQLAYSALFHLGNLPLLLSPVVAMGAGGMTWLVWEQVLQRRERARTRQLLERYVSRNVVKEVLDNPKTFFDSLGGVRKPVAVMFTDLRGFTPLTEHADSQAIVAQLNEYFSKMVDQVFAHDGTLDKFIGDAIMAVWGNVQTDGPVKDVERAVTAGFEMQRCLAELNSRWLEAGRPSLSMGIGINYGEAIVGNIGSEEKMELTVIGDPVNLASRLEGLTKEYGLDLVLGEAAGELARAHFHLQLVDRVQVKGRSAAVRVYTVVGRASEPLAAEMQEYLACYESSFALYQAGEFRAAADGFRRCLTIRPGDALAKTYVGRCETLASEPPQEEWQGVYVMTSK
jgi:adenylate cyclase